jgi:hypothetical protein
MIVLRKSRSGFFVAAGFFLLASIAYATHTVSVFTNAGNSGESGVLLLPFALPWISMVPEPVFDSALWRSALLPGWWMIVLGNAFILYCASGGLGWRRNAGS